MANVFDSQAPAPTIDMLVGEDKKFKTVEDLVKSYAASQEHIGRIEGENAGFRSELATRTAVGDQLEKFRQSQREPPTPPVQNPNGSPPPSQDQEKPDLAKLVREEIEKTEQNRTRDGNLASVTKRLVEIYGSEDKAAEFVAKKARETGLTQEDIRNLAGRSPTAAYELFGVNRAPSPSAAPRGDVNTEALRRTASGVVEGSYAYYKQMQKDQPALYNRQETQAQRMKDAQRLGDAFFE